MATESRFDDLDLREEPASAAKAENYNSIPALAQTDASVGCTQYCCV